MVANRGREMARFDQQPIEAQSMIDALIEAYYITKDKKWIDKALMCFKWFLGEMISNLLYMIPQQVVAETDLCQMELIKIKEQNQHYPVYYLYFIA